MLKPGADLGRLKLQEPLGSGGMGAVFAAVDEKLKREVAVKVLRRSGADEHRRLLGEARMLSRLDHPHVCRVYDVVEHEDEEGEVLSLLVMERVRGLNLAEILAQPGSGRLSFADRLRIGEQIADALGAAHAEGIVHRDLKPGNVMVTSSDTVKVLDFGLARPIEIEETQVLDGLDEQDELRVEELEPLGKPDSAAPTYWRSIAGGSTRGVAGTPAYMSPEQARAERATAASDIYSFGLLFHELFGGRSPYGDLADSPLLGKVVAEGKTRPLQGVDADLVSLAERMKAAAPADRPTAHEVKAELRRIADKPRRRRRRWIAAAAVALVLAGVAKYTFDLRHERNVALEARREAEEVSEFLVRLFEHENPISQTSEAATIEDLLALAVLRIDRDLADQPHARGRLLQTLGRAYSGRGMYDEADPLLAEALALARDRPEDRKNLLGALNARWSLENHWSRWPKAAGLAREALELVRRIYGSDPEEPEGVLETATALMRLAQTLSAQQGAQEAEELMAELTELSRRKGEDGRPILDESMRVEVLQTLARVKAYRSQFGESIQALQEVVRVVESSGPGSVTPADGVLAYLDLCNMLLTAGRQGEAEVPCRRQLELIEELLPSSHPWQVTGRQALASWLWTVGGNEEAESLLMAALQRAEATDPESLLTAGVLYALSDHFSRLGRYETAEPFGARAYARFRDLLGEDNERTLAVALGHAALLLRLERYGEAETILRRLLDEDRIADYADRRLVGGSRVQLAKLLLKQGHGAECVQEAERAAIELAEVYGADHQRVADARTIAEDCRHLSQGAQQ